MKNKERHMTEVFVVGGSTGEYSDRDDWIVGWFPTKEEAEEFKEECQKIVNQVDMDKRWDFKHPLDPRCHIDYTGTFYSAYPIPKVVWSKVKV